jgi:hypothetical protein
MRKKLKTALFCISALLATPVISASPYLFQVSPSVDYELPPNDPKVISNVFRWTINAECTVVESDETSSILFKILRKTGTINQIILAKGETLRVAVHPDDTFQVIAIPGASVELTNEGETTITARCASMVDTAR